MAICIGLAMCALAPVAIAAMPAEISGSATDTIQGRGLFSNPFPGLDDQTLSDFYIGNSFFKRNWVVGPATTTARDGLGPLFNARSCSGCHALDGRALAPSQNPLADDSTPGLLLRLSVPGMGTHGEPLPEPHYGDQLSTLGIPGVPPEGTLNISYAERRGLYADGTAYSLRIPKYSVTSLNYGRMDRRVMMSPRLAPQVIGMGLIEGIPEERIVARARNNARRPDKIRGKENRVWDVTSGTTVLGRFGWKAETGSVYQQTALAFVADIGITSRHYRSEQCMPAQAACRQNSASDATSLEAGDSAHGSEIDDKTLARVSRYARLLAVPHSRNSENPQVRQGQLLFELAHCDGCHVKRQKTGLAPGEPSLSFREFQPYTDLLLHNMGRALSDGRSVYRAAAADWRTPPLWGLGLIQQVNGEAFFLHDGRARSIPEAILWHGGEALESRERFRKMPASDRNALVRFVESL